MFDVQCERDNGQYIGVGVSYRLAGMLSATPPSHPTLPENQKTQNLKLNRP